MALLGRDAGGLSASTIGRLTEAWCEEHARWSKRDLSAKRYIYFWVDGIHVQARLEDSAQCLLIIIGATPEGRKELVGLTDGVRESAQSWRELLLDLKRRGLSIGPELAIADGALGFWQAVEEVWPHTRGQRCWVHKTANVLNKLPNSQQPKAKRALQEIWMAETKKDALAAFDAFVEIWSVKYDKAVECLIRDRDALLAFYDFPAEHWQHLRTTDEMDKRFFIPRRFFCSAARAILLEHGGTLAWNGIAFLAWLELAVSGDYGRRARATSWRNVTRRLQASPDCLFGPAELRHPRAGFLAAVVSIATRIVRNFAPPGRQSTSRGRVAP